MDRQVDTELHNETSSDGQADSRRRRRHERRGVWGGGVLLVQDYGSAFSFLPSVTHRDEKNCTKYREKRKKNSSGSRA